MLRSGVSVTRDLFVQPRDPKSAWHGALLMTATPFPLLPLSSGSARTPLGKIFGITKKTQPWRNPTGTAIHPCHHPSQEPICTG